jgi:hypothetical protein
MPTKGFQNTSSKICEQQLPLGRISIETLKMRIRMSACSDLYEKAY